MQIKGNSQSQAVLNRTIGTVLRERRESLGLSWEDISREIHIQVKYLRAVEDGHTIDLPDNIYFRMFAKVYSEQMGLSFRKVVSVVQENPPGLMKSDANTGEIAHKAPSRNEEELSTGDLEELTSLPQASTSSGQTGSVREVRSPGLNRIKFGGVSLAHSVNWRPIIRYSMIGIGAILLGFVIRYATISKGFARSSGPDEVVSELAVKASTGEGFGAKSSALPVQPFRLRARATADVDLRVLGDSNTLYDEELESGKVLNFEARYRFEITASDRNRIEFFIDDQQLIRLPSEDGQISSFEITQFNYRDYLEVKPAKKE